MTAVPINQGSRHLRMGYAFDVTNISRIMTNKISNFRTIQCISNKFITKMIALTEDYFHVRLDEGTVSYSRFVTHLKFLSARVFSTDREQAVNMGGDGLYEMLKKQYSDIYKFLDVVSDMTNHEYGYVLSDSDRIYLIIHLARVLREKP